MPSNVDVANRALSKLGDDRIVSFGDNTPKARAISAAYDIVRDAVLRAHPWNFATKRVALAASVDIPAYKYDKSYPLPSDFLRLLEIQGQTDGHGDWEVVGRAIECNASSPLRITYTSRVADPNQYDSMFIETFATRLAAELALEIPDNTALSERLDAKYREMLARAAMVDSKESPPTPPINGTWLDSRIADFD